METIKPPKQEFMARLERAEPAARDHSCTIIAKDCMRLYFYKMVLGFTSKITPPFFRFGSAYHVFREVLETHEGENHEKFVAALASAVEYFGGKDPVAGGKYDFLTEKRLIKTCQVAFKRWKKEKEDGVIEVVAVEQPFDIYLKDGITRRGGKNDQIIRTNGRPAGRDWKTSSSNAFFYERTLEPNDQFTGYLTGINKLTGEFTGLFLVEVVFNEKSKGPTIKPFITQRTKWQLDKWEDEQIHLEKMIQVCREEDVWPMYEKRCPFCEFRSVCSKGTEAAQMAQLESKFKHKPWDYKNITND